MNKSAGERPTAADLGAPRDVNAEREPNLNGLSVAGSWSTAKTDDEPCMIGSWKRDCE